MGDPCPTNRVVPAVTPRVGDIARVRCLQAGAAPGVNALIQPSPGFEVIGNMQNWITFDFHA